MNHRALSESPGWYRFLIKPSGDKADFPRLPWRVALSNKRSRCASCRSETSLVPYDVASEVFFCSECIEQSHLGALSDLYDDLGGGD